MTLVDAATKKAVRADDPKAVATLAAAAITVNGAPALEAAVTTAAAAALGSEGREEHAAEDAAASGGRGGAGSGSDGSGCGGGIDRAGARGIVEGTTTRRSGRKAGTEVRLHCPFDRVGRGSRCDPHRVPV